MTREIPYGHEVKVFSRSRGESAVAKAAYRAGASLVDQRTGEVHDFTAKRHVEHTEIMAPSGAPEWVFDRARLWNAVEVAEKRSNSQVAREIRLTLPRELSREQQIGLVREWVKCQYVAHGMIADFAIHAPDAADGGEQPHAHIMLTMRGLDMDGPSGFSLHKAREWNDLFADEDAFKTAARGTGRGKTFVAASNGLETMRADWAALENAHLAQAGIEGRVDHRTLEAQRADALARGDLEAAERLNRPAEPKLRPGEKQRGATQRAADVEEIRIFKAEVAAEVIDLAAERQKRKATLPRERGNHSPAAIARRRDRARRIAEARTSMSTMDSGNQAARDRYKLRLLQEHYRQQMPPEVAQHLAWVRARSATGELVVQMRDGGRVRDDGVALRARGEAHGSAMAVMSAAAKAHGWAEVTVSGSRAFQERSAEALTRVGIRVSNADLVEIVKRTQARMAGEAILAEAAFVQRQREQAEGRQDQYQRAAQDHEWTGPDGRRRPFFMRIDGLPQPVAARLSDEEIRDHLQPEWAAIYEAVKDLRAKLRDQQGEYAILGAFGRLTAGTKKAEIAKLTSALQVAEGHAAVLDRAWHCGLSARGQDVKRQAEKMRRAAEVVRDTAAANAVEGARRVSELRTLSLTLNAMADKGELQSSPPGLSEPQRLEWLKRQAEEWRQNNAGVGDPATRAGAGMRRP